MKRKECLNPDNMRFTRYVSLSHRFTRRSDKKRGGPWQKFAC
jgi:hypothetical protein